MVHLTVCYMIMSRTLFRVKLLSLFTWMSNSSLLKTAVYGVICMVHLTVCYYHATYAFLILSIKDKTDKLQRELGFKSLIDRRRFWRYLCDLILAFQRSLQSKSCIYDRFHRTVSFKNYFLLYTKKNKLNPEIRMLKYRIPFEIYFKIS